MAFAGAVALVLAACAVNPVTGERQLALLSESQEIEIGRQAAAAAEAQLGLVDDAELQAYVAGLGTRLAEASERPGLPWKFGVIDDPTPNAFAAPGGFIYITRGMLALMRNEAELVSVLGHEVGHVTARHSVEMISRAQLAQIGLGIGSIISPTVAQFGNLAAGGLQVLFLSYGRDAERQADDLGFGYALEQGYDVREMVNVFAALERSSELAGHSPAPSWLSTHPDPGRRIARIEQHLANLDRPQDGARIGEADYLARIDGMPFGINPRNGYFEDTRFHHPELAFSIEFPAGWRTANFAQAVVAGSEQQDAQMQLTLAEGTPAEAAQAFFSQQGVAAEGVRSESVNGLPGVAGRFQAQTEQGVLGGFALFVALDERTYAILGITSAQRMAAYDPVFRQAAGSFQRLTDPVALARQPDRIRIVTLPRAMTVAEFAREHSSSIPVEQLALINQCATPDDLMPAGFRAKRVVGH